MPEPLGRFDLTAQECKALRVALIIGDPAMQGSSDDTLESAKHKLRVIEGRTVGAEESEPTSRGRSVP